MKLNLGCGNDYREGWVNVDIGDVKKDKELNMNETPYDFSDDYFDFVDMNQSLEHAERSQFVSIMKELHRIVKHGGIVHIRSAMNRFWDFPLHSNPLTARTFKAFDYDDWYGYDLPKFRVLQRITSDMIGTIPEVLSCCFPFTLLSQDIEVYLKAVK